MNPNLEAIIRATGVFISVFFTTRWTSKSEPAYDLPLFIFFNETGRRKIQSLLHSQDRQVRVNLISVIA